MPIRRGVVVAPPTDTPTTPTPETPRLRDAPRASWRAPDGTVLDLTSRAQGFRVLRGLKGFGAMPVTLNTDKLPNGGSNVRNVRREHREMDLPVRVHGSNHGQFRGRRELLVDAFTQTDELGPGELIIYRPDGSYRSIKAYYVTGLEGDDDGWIAESFLITLLAERPWWLGPELVDDAVLQLPSAGSYLTGYPNVSSSRTLGNVDITNPGLMAAYPTWTITGPASSVTIAHWDTDLHFTIDPNYEGAGALPAGQTITVQTDPMHIVGPLGQPYTGALNWPGAALFPLRRGLNKVGINVSGPGEGTRVAWQFAPRYRSA
ncbi:phage tail family protein [Micromonospora sp. STR1s_5]|nr:phage tail family protein [Micromonospora sp. STR1s_5]